MPKKQTKKQSKKQSRSKNSKSKSASTKAGKYVREEMHQLHTGKGRPQSRSQAIAIGLSRAREAGIRVPRKSSNRSSQAARSH